MPTPVNVMFGVTFPENHPYLGPHQTAPSPNSAPGDRTQTPKTHTSNTFTHIVTYLNEDIP